MDSNVFHGASILPYLDLPPTYQPSPSGSPIDFLNLHIRHLPPHLLQSFSSVTTPKQRTNVPVIRNRRVKYTQTNPDEFRFASASRAWPNLWQGITHGSAGLRSGQEEGKDERQWAEREFMGGRKQEVGKLGSLLGGYEEEREAERFRSLRRDYAARRQDEEEQEEDDEDDSDEGPHSASKFSGPEDTEQDARRLFERHIHERFIYGLLEDTTSYDRVDWDESLDSDDDREAEAHWFEVEEPDNVPISGDTGEMDY
ncbi:hypothetical protein JAAARDRAFT_117675 [Jaapia argillacea MUCL 33604]|uniref:CCD97-like C-terminal domain-containing protein n=1 Tax=Jaapia argillacea MUCL 33604 TaxID=933084 RepID=A0A067QL58_9AGAM|nr:hypothetical protein JAAARDRAFT_117675 [Jaapia argillacea MUCL 33604]